MSDTGQFWKIYALGGGLGHFNRALSLSRLAISRGHKVEILTNSRFVPHIPWEKELGELGNVISIDSNASSEHTSQVVVDWLRRQRFDRLIVDTFPRGLAGELPELLAEVTVPKALIHRDLNPKYIKQHDVEKAVAKFDQLILPGEDAPFKNAVRARRTAPWFIRDSEELQVVTEARKRVGIRAGDSRRLLLVCSTGRAQEEGQFKKIGDKLRGLLDGWLVRLVSPAHNAAELKVWPLLSLLNGVDALVGGGGYNLVNEARATETPLFAFSLERRYDRQRRRLKTSECVSDVSKIVSGIQFLPKRSVSKTYVNGAHKAVDLIESSCA